MTTQQILQQEFDSLAREMKLKHIQLGMKASGRWIESIEVVATPVSGTILGEHYTEFLVDGRGPGKYPPIDVIRKWILDKGVRVRDISINSLAFLIARKIHKEGTKYFKQGGTDLIDAVITPQRIQRIIDRVGNQMMLFLVELISRKFKEAA